MTTSQQKTERKEHHQPLRKDANASTSFYSIDNRSESNRLTELREIASNSPQVLQLQAYQKIAQLMTAAPGVNKPQGRSEYKSNNTGLPDQLKAGAEHLSGMSLDHVKVHYNSRQPAQLNALAYAQGSEIHIGPGQEKHLPHEVWHVVQQQQGRVLPTFQMKKSVFVNDDKRLEAEADSMGTKALQLHVGSTRFSIKQPVNECIGSGPTVVQRKIGIEFETRNKLWKRKTVATNNNNATTNNNNDDEFYELGLFDDSVTIPAAKGPRAWEVPVVNDTESVGDKAKRLGVERNDLAQSAVLQVEDVPDGEDFQEIYGADMLGKRWYVESDSGWAEFITKPLTKAEAILCLEKIKEYLEWVRTIGLTYVPFKKDEGQDPLYGIMAQGILTPYGRPQITINDTYVGVNDFMNDVTTTFTKNVNPGPDTYRTYDKGKADNLLDTRKVNQATVLSELNQLYTSTAKAETKIMALSKNAKIVNLLRHMYRIIAAAFHSTGGAEYMKSKFLFLTRLNPGEIAAELDPTDIQELKTIRTPFLDLVKDRITKGGPIFNKLYLSGLVGDHSGITQKLTLDSYFDELVNNKNDLILSVLQKHLPPSAADRAIGAFGRDASLAPPGTNTVEFRGILPRGDLIMDIQSFINMLNQLNIP